MQMTRTIAVQMFFGKNSSIPFLYHKCLGFLIVLYNTSHQPKIWSIDESSSNSLQLRMKVHNKVKLPVKDIKNKDDKLLTDNSLRPHISRPCCNSRSSEPSEEENDRKILNSGAFDFLPSSMLKNYTGIPRLPRLWFPWFFI